MPTRRAVLALFGLAALIAGCGGGSGDGPSVSSMSATPTAYGRTALWTVSGLNLGQGITFHITSGSCDSVSEVAGGTDVQRQFSCRTSSLGELVGEVDDSGGRKLASLRVVIPVPKVRLTLTQGNIDLELDPEKAPITVNNFLNYVNANFFNNTIFHRVIAGFVIQGGGYTPGNPDPAAKNPTQQPIALESNNGLLNLRGALAMARTSEPNSATSQFYINLVDNPSLDYKSDAEPGYAVFGKVVAGLEVVDAIGAVPTRDASDIGLPNLPTTNVVVTTARQTQ